jgi:hypothetical protein
MRRMKMPKYQYFLIEKTVLSVEIEAEDRDDADKQVEDLLDEADMDWGMGDMEVTYEYNGEEC